MYVCVCGGGGGGVCVRTCVCVCVCTSLLLNIFLVFERFLAEPIKSGKI